MIRHVVMFKWRTGTSSDDVAAIAAELEKLPASVPEIRRYQFGADVGVNEASWDFAIVAEFDDADGYLTYRDHPAHQAFIAEHINPHAENRASVQYEL